MRHGKFATAQQQNIASWLITTSKSSMSTSTTALVHITISALHWGWNKLTLAQEMQDGSHGRNKMAMKDDAHTELEQLQRRCRKVLHGRRRSPAMSLQIPWSHRICSRNRYARLDDAEHTREWTECMADASSGWMSTGHHSPGLHSSVERVAPRMAQRPSRGPVWEGHRPNGRSTVHNGSRRGPSSSQVLRSCRFIWSLARSPWLVIDQFRGAGLWWLWVLVEAKLTSFSSSLTKVRTYDTVYDQQFKWSSQCIITAY